MGKQYLTESRLTIWGPSGFAVPARTAGGSCCQKDLACVPAVTWPWGRRTWLQYSNSLPHHYPVRLLWCIPSGAIFKGYSEITISSKYSDSHNFWPPGGETIQPLAFQTLSCLPIGFQVPFRALFSTYKALYDLASGHLQDCPLKPVMPLWNKSEADADIKLVKGLCTKHNVFHLVES